MRKENSMPRVSGGAMKTRIRKSFPGMMLTAALLLGTLPTSFVYAEEVDEIEETDTEKEIIKVQSAEELMKVVENCDLDSWSADKIIEVTSDISLSGMDFEGIPVFAGTFNGNGHTISGFHIKGEGYADGFFRNITSTGIVQDLKLSGMVESENDKICTGGLCGINAGWILECTFTGSVEGKTETGGIAGENEGTGTISSCYSYGTVTGYNMAGGIAGANYGAIRNCVNEASINSDSSWLEEQDEAGMEWIFEEDVTERKLVSGTDIGGIAGFSRGILINCTNNGVVGYEHNGYNIGGIAGRQSGQILFCENTGRIYGRKDVGGIVGQMEPYISVEEAESISEAVQTLHDQVSQFLDDAGDAGDVVSADFDQLRAYSDSALDEADVIADGTTDFIDKNVDAVNEVANRIDYLMDQLPGILDETSAAVDDMDDATEALGKVVDALDFSDDLTDNDYDETKYARLSFVSGVGGEVGIASDTMSPEEGELVSFTVTPEEGYSIKDIIIQDASGNTIDHIPADTNSTSYSFVMPKDNVVVKVSFKYTATGPAGQGSGSVTVKPDPRDDDSTTAPTVPVNPIPGDDTNNTAGDDSELTDSVNKVDSYENTGTNTSDENPVSAGISSVLQTPGSLSKHKATGTGTTDGYSLYVAVNNSDPDTGDTGDTTDTTKTKHKITVYVNGEEDTSTGGEGYYKDDKVAVYVNPGSGCQYTITITQTDSAEVTYTVNNNLYQFDMPDADVKVNVSFTKADIILESDAGGKASVSVSDDVVTLTAKPNSGYEVDGLPTAANSKGESLTVVQQSAGSKVYTIKIPADSGTVSIYVPFKASTEADAVSSSGDDLSKNVALLQQQMAKVSASMNKIQTLMDAYDGDIAKIRAAGKENELVQDVVELATNLSAAGETLSYIMSDLNIIVNIMTPYMEQALADASVKMDDVIDSLEKVYDHMDTAFGLIRSTITYLNGKFDIQFAKIGDDVDQSVDRLFEQLDIISDYAGKINDDISLHSDILEDDMRAINDQVNKIFQLFVERIEDAEDLYYDESGYEDISEDDIDESTDGKVERCTNDGVVQADVNVGGIAGSLAIDEEDPEGNAAGSVNRSFGSKYLTKCVVNRCVNNGQITGKKNGVGGIAGYMNLGIIANSEAYGNAESTEGEYVGGICGESYALIKGCYSLMSLTGSQYVGGIAGSGDRITGCYAMTLIDDEAVNQGAIAGWIPTEEDERLDYEENINGNYFVNSRLGALDNVSYAGIAQPITYEELLETVGLPSEYRHLTITFIAEDEVVDKIEVKYGTPLSQVTLPQTPKVAGSYGKWPDLTDMTMEGCMTLYAEYNDTITTVASEETVLVSEAGEVKKPYAYIDGIYTDEAKLSAKVTEWTAEETEAAGVRENAPSTSFDIRLENADIGEEDISKVRLYNPYDDIKAVYVQNDDDSWEEIPYSEYGQYIQVEMQGDSAAYCIVSGELSTTRIIIIAAAVAVVLILLIIIKKKKKSRG